MTLWQISGTACGGGEARAASVQTLTPSDSPPPDHRAALEAAHPGWSWASVAAVAAVARLPAAWDALDDFAAGLVLLAETHDRHRRAGELDTWADD